MLAERDGDVRLAHRRPKPALGRFRKKQFNINILATKRGCERLHEASLARMLWLLFIGNYRYLVGKSINIDNEHISCNIQCSALVRDRLSWTAVNSAADWLSLTDLARCQGNRSHPAA